MKAVLIIAHPDDDALFGGPFQRAHCWMQWYVICATYRAEDERGCELLEWQARNGCRQVDFLELEDAPADYASGTSSFGYEEVGRRLRELKLEADLILTHNGVGEYGHPHHIVIGQAVRALYSARVPLLEFGHSLPEVDFQITVPDFHELALRCYRSQAVNILDHYQTERLCISAGYRWVTPATPRVSQRHIGEA
jgi:LmbE family N-acetylglucosaminyl deacetylase